MKEKTETQNALNPDDTAHAPGSRRKQCVSACYKLLKPYFDDLLGFLEANVAVLGLSDRQITSHLTSANLSLGALYLLQSTRLNVLALHSQAAQKD